MTQAINRLSNHSQSHSKKLEDLIQFLSVAISEDNDKE